jgi:hypothetical protein
MSSEPDIHLYTAGTPNGIKISITLEELGYAISSPCKTTSSHVHQQSSVQDNTDSILQGNTKGAMVQGDQSQWTDPGYHGQVYGWEGDSSL